MILLTSCKGGSAAGGSNTEQVMLAGNSVARNVYERGLIPAFKAEYAKTHPGHAVNFIESYDGSGAQTRAILSGLKADVAALSLSPEIDKLAAAGLAAKDWSSGTDGGVPATSVVVMVVRKDNPKEIRDWDDLMRQDVDSVLPNPETSGAAQWNVAAIDAWANVPANAIGELSVLSRIRQRVKAFGKSGKEAMQIFASGVGDVIVGWECEALDRKAAGDAIDIVYPSTTIQMEPPVAVITSKGQNPNASASEFVAFLNSPAAQEIYAAHNYRPHTPSATSKSQATFPVIKNLVTIEKLGGWPAVQKKLFGPEGLWTKAGG